MISLIIGCLAVYIIIGGMIAAILGDFVPSTRYNTYDRIGVTAIWPLFVIKGILWVLWGVVNTIPKALGNVSVVPMIAVRCMKPAFRYLVFGLPK